MGTPVLLVLLSAAPAATPQAALVEAIAARVGGSAADVAVADLVLPADVPADAEFTVNLPSYAIREGHVSVSLSSDRGVWRLYPEVRLWVHVPVAAADVARGDVVTTRTERVRLGELRGGTPVDPGVTWLATTTLHAGQPVTTGRVRARPDLLQGATVDVYVQRGALSVRAPGQLLADGVIGQPVAVLNLATRTQQFGTLRADGTVLLGGS